MRGRFSSVFALVFGGVACSRTALEVEEDGHGEDAAVRDGDADGTDSTAGTDTGADVSADTPVPVCGPATCGPPEAGVGCCWKGECVPYLDYPMRNLCGNQGEPCEECTGKYAYDGGGGGCWFGTCGYQQPNCGPANCDGCCSGWLCAVGTFGVACGSGGQPCSRCYEAEGTGRCVAQPDGGGHCENKPPCSPKTCSGCCYGDVCAAGNQDFACGAGGNTCQDCVFLAQKCASGKCVF